MNRLSTSLPLSDGRIAVIRAPVPEDAAELVALNRATALDYGNLIPEPEEVLTDVDAQRSILEDALEARGSGFQLAAFVGEEAAGSVTLFSVGLAKLSHVVELGMAVRPGFKGIGLGRALLGAGLSGAASRTALSKVVLRVLANNEPALRLYKSAGFEEEGRQVNQVRFRDGSFRDVIWMARFLR